MYTISVYNYKHKGGSFLIMEKKITISDAELEIIEILWQSSTPLSAYEIRQHLNQTKQWERTTVLTLIRRLVQKGAILQEKRDMYYYTPYIKKEDYQKQETKNFINKIYKGKSKDLIASLFQDESLTKEDIDDLRNYFN